MRNWKHHRHNRFLEFSETRYLRAIYLQCWDDGGQAILEMIPGEYILTIIRKACLPNSWLSDSLTRWSALYE